jgi:hypothetical protein
MKNIEIGGASRRGPSEAAKQNAIETINSASREYQKINAEIERLNATPESIEKDEALTVQYGKRRLSGERLQALGIDPDTIE